MGGLLECRHVVAHHMGELLINVVLVNVRAVYRVKLITGGGVIELEIALYLAERQIDPKIIYAVG